MRQRRNQPDRWAKYAACGCGARPMMPCWDLRMPGSARTKKVPCPMRPRLPR